MKVKEIIAIIEDFAPLSWQEEWDNSGLQVGDPESEVKGLMFTLDITLENIELAVKQGINLIISHHPMIFGSIRSVTPETLAGQAIIKAITKGIAIYSCHTNIDSAPKGVNYRLAHKLGLKNIEPLQYNPYTGTGLGCIGELPKSMDRESFLSMLKKLFGLQVIKTNNSSATRIERVAVCGGSGSSLLGKAINKEADAFVSSDMKYHNFGDAPSKILLADIGHFESEVQVLKLFYDLITEKFPKFAVPTQYAESNHVIYYL